MSGPRPSDHPCDATSTRADLVERVRALGHTTRTARRLVDEVLGIMGDALVEDGSLKLQGFGKFEVVHREARIGRHPRTGAPMDLPPRRQVAFRPSPRLRRELTEALGGEP